MTDDHMELTDEQYKAQLVRLRRMIRLVPLSGFDSDAVGDKDTQCTWGLCKEGITYWPDPATWLFPDLEGRQGEPKYGQKHHLCPLDRRTQEEASVQGCFYTCMFFNREKGAPGLTVERAEGLCDVRLLELAARSR